VISHWQEVVGWDVKHQVAQAKDGHRFPVAGIPLAVECVIMIPKPKTWDGREFPIAHEDGDADNYGKGIRDACQGILWEEDCIIISSSDLLLWANHDYLCTLGSGEEAGCYILFADFDFGLPHLRLSREAKNQRCSEKDLCYG
jgi:hypothetical protein